jgi:hypothetical protein
MRCSFASRKIHLRTGLGTHKIARLSVLYKEPVWSVPILGNLRALFVVHGETILSVSIGDHSIYK